MLFKFIIAFIIQSFPMPHEVQYENIQKHKTSHMENITYG